ncbi:MAG TPA: TetR/AcrR family transcriptional regulator [Gemmatimonadales bacterium]|nr:TetR/AcrR family transcriptional regulator [Gemmatimonadales bacterium]
MRRNAVQSRAAIGAAALRLLRRQGRLPTLDAIAAEARCAKGLVNYHFPSKQALLASVADSLGAERRRRWENALAGSTPEAAISATWDLVQAESREGIALAWRTLGGAAVGATDHTVSLQATAFGQGLAQALTAMLKAAGWRARVPVAELGWCLAAVTDGIERLLDLGVDPRELQGAYAAAWLGLLSVSGPP